MNITDYSPQEIASRLMLSIMNYEKNKSYLEKYPHVVKGEYAFAVNFCVGNKNEEGLYSSYLTVNHEILEKWGYSEEVLFSQAIDNSAKLLPASVNRIDDTTYCITNRLAYNGAASLFYDSNLVMDELKRIGAGMEGFSSGANVVLYPCSDNGVVVYFPDDSISPKELMEAHQELFGEYISDVSSQELGNVLGTEAVLLNLRTETIQSKDFGEINLDLLENARRMERSI